MNVYKKYLTNLKYIQNEYLSKYIEINIFFIINIIIIIYFIIFIIL